MAACLLGLRFRIPPDASLCFRYECCVLSGRDLCDGLITLPEEPYRLWRVVVCDQDTSKMRRLNHATGLYKIQPQWVVTPGKQTNNTCTNGQPRSHISIPGSGKGVFSSPKCPDRLWAPSSLLASEYRWCFPWGLSGEGVLSTEGNE